MFESEALRSRQTSTPSAEDSDRVWIAHWFDADPTARLIVGRDFTILAANRQARSLLASNRCLIERSGKLTCADREGQDGLYSLVEALGADARLGVLCAGRDLATLVRVQPLQPDPASPLAVTVRSVSEQLPIECPDLEPLFGVTPAEHRVTVLLLQGYTPAVIAEILQKSVLTVRTHLKRVYSKLGVRTREQLFARVSSFMFIN